MRHTYTDPKYCIPFQKGEFITLTRENGGERSSELWIIGIVGENWDPSYDDDVLLSADYTFHKGCDIGDEIRIYEEPQAACPYYEGWHHSTEDEIKIFEDALAHTGHRYDCINCKIVEIMPTDRMVFNYHLLSEELAFIEENLD